MTPDGTLGVVVTGALDEKLFRAIAAIIPEGTWEFVCHPGYNDDDLKSAKTRLRQSRETELRVLTMPEVRQLLLNEGIALISYRDLTTHRDQAIEFSGCHEASRSGSNDLRNLWQVPLWVIIALEPAQIFKLGGFYHVCHWGSPASDLRPARTCVGHGRERPTLPSERHRTECQHHRSLHLRHRAGVEGGRRHRRSIRDQESSLQSNLGDGSHRTKESSGRSSVGHGSGVPMDFQAAGGGAV